MKRIFNIDECGFHGSKDSTDKIMAPRGVQSVSAIVPAENDHFSVAGAVSAATEVLPPVVLFANGGPHANIFGELGAGERVGVFRTEKGYMDTQSFILSLEFWEARMAERNVVGDVVLLLDGHASHDNVQVAAWCRDPKREWQIVLLPSHTTHKLQPLDVNFFKMFKDHWRKSMKDLADEAFYQSDISGRLFSLAETSFEDKALIAVLDAHAKMTPESVRTGYRNTGIWPLNPEPVSEIRKAAHVLLLSLLTVVNYHSGKYKTTIFTASCMYCRCRIISSKRMKF